MRLALIQLAVTANKHENVRRAVEFVKEAAHNGAQIVCLPECFNCPYGTKYFPNYAETIPGHTTESLSDAAKQSNVVLVGGSMPEKSKGKLYNTCPIFNASGKLVATHRKVHLFDIDVPGKITFKESECLSAGDQLTVMDTQYCKVGVGICYDIRFQEMANVYGSKGCSLLLYPGAFNMTTGPAHWELLQRCRAVDNQLFVAACSPARDAAADYVAWGHSTVVNPWGEVIAKAEEKEAVIYADIDLDKVEEIRGQIPVQSQKRHDLYELKDKSDTRTDIA